MNEDNKNKLHLEPDEKELLIDHNYDGIQELNHPLPSWWAFVFWASILYSAGYYLYYEFMGGASLQQEFAQDFSRVQALQMAEKKKNGSFDLQHYQALLAQDGVKKGEAIYTGKCMSCHKDKGRGGIGPNLTDEFWLYAKGTPESIFPVVFDGVPDEGMPSWSNSLSRDEIYQVVAYVQSLNNTKHPEGKRAEGNKVE